MQTAAIRRIILLSSAAVMLLAGGCARLAVEGGDKPIHIVMDVNLRVDHELDQFFAFEQQPPATQPTTATAPSTQPTAAAE
jgi:hypothetical protein